MTPGPGRLATQYPRRGAIRTCAIGSALLAQFACNPSTPGPAPRLAAGSSDGRLARSVTVVVSGDTAGWIVPCGCTSNQSGGLPRRGTVVRRLRADHAVIVADAGGAPGGTSLYERQKFEAILAGERAMGIAAHNLGAPEAALGAPYLREVQKRLDIPFVSANLRDADGTLIAPPLREVETSPGRPRVTLVGVVSPRLVRGGLKADPPRAAILEAIGGRDTRRALVVLAYLPEAELRQLAAELPEADLVVGGPTGQSIAPARVGPTWLASATNKGKFLIQMHTDGPGAPWSGQVVELSSAVPDDRAQERNLDEFRAGLARRDFSAEQTGLVPRWPTDIPDGYQVAGTQACRACHGGDCDVWQGSKHSLAWQTLHDRGLHVDPQCQLCHTTAYGLPGGFQSIATSAARTAVGCESCHGPARAHVDDPKKKTLFVARDQCLTCHDPENSPRFDYDGYWKLIRHGTSTVRTSEPRGKDHP